MERDFTGMVGDARKAKEEMLFGNEQPYEVVEDMYGEVSQPMEKVE